MIKMKCFLVGLLSSFMAFSIFLIILSLTAAKLGVMKFEVYRNLSMVLAVLSILMGSFLATKIAKEKGALYGLMVSGVWLALTLGAASLLGFIGEGVEVALRIIMYLVGGVLGGIAGVTLKKRTKYI